MTINLDSVEQAGYIIREMILSTALATLLVRALVSIMWQTREFTLVLLTITMSTERSWAILAEMTRQTTVTASLGFTGLRGRRTMSLWIRTFQVRMTRIAAVVAVTGDPRVAWTVLTLWRRRDMTSKTTSTADVNVRAFNYNHGSNFAHKQLKVI